VEKRGSREDGASVLRRALLAFAAVLRGRLVVVIGLGARAAARKAACDPQRTL
jgi:hypothetical protein